MLYNIDLNFESQLMNKMYRTNFYFTYLFIFEKKNLQCNDFDIKEKYLLQQMLFNNTEL